MELNSKLNSSCFFLLTAYLIGAGFNEVTLDFMFLLLWARQLKRRDEMTKIMIIRLTLTVGYNLKTQLFSNTQGYS